MGPLSVVLGGTANYALIAAAVRPGQNLQDGSLALLLALRWAGLAGRAGLGDGKNTVRDTLLSYY